MIGRTISHYRILSELGRGGMGVVYEAADTMLGRRAALKFLPDNVGDESQSLARFQREARAASSLNHPNICTIYEIGEDQGHWFIAMELLEGHCLSASLAAVIPLDKLLDWAIQITDALDAAHARGIVHRDLKPSNLFLTRRDQVKVLDFGLAKITDASPDAASGNTSLPTEILITPLTGAGHAVGTIAYMSPEQARGENLDSRSDLFSLGTLLYQMATGCLPFEGKTTAVIFEGILNRQPVPVIQLNPDAPVELQRILAKCQEKDPDLRYQHASDLRADLKRLKRDTGSGQAWAKPAGSSASLESPTVTAVLPSSPAMPVSRVSSGIVVAARQHRLGFTIGGLAALAVLAAAAFGIYQLLDRPARLPFQNMTMLSVTFGGDTWAASLSPDGKYLATLRREPDGRDSLWMRHLATTSDTRIVPPADSPIQDVTFGPDAGYVYFREQSAGGAASDLFRVPVLGGPAARMVHDIDSAPSFNKSGGRFCFMRYNQVANTQLLLTANLDGSDEKTVFSSQGVALRNPVWSPDGKHIAAAEILAGLLSRISILDASSGRVTQTYRLPETIYEPNYLAWVASGLMVVYRDVNLGRRQIAYVSYPKFEFHRVTNDLNNYDAVSVSADGKSMSTVLASSETSLELFPGAGDSWTDSAATPLGNTYWFDWIDDTRMALTREDNLGIQLLSLPAGQRTPLLSGSDPRVYDLDRCGPDALVFTGSRAASNDVARIFTLDLTGGGVPREVTSGKADQYSRCTPDGSWLIYYSFEDYAIHKISIKGGAAAVLVKSERKPDDQFSITPDGKQLLIRTLSLEPGTKYAEFDFIALDTGRIERRIPVDANTSYPILSPGGKHIAFLRLERGVTNIWLQPIAGGEPTRLTDFHLLRSTRERIQRFGWSPDGKHLAVLRDTAKGNAVILRQ